MISIAYHADLKEVQGDPRLAALLAAPPSGAPFDRGEWLSLLAAECGLSPLLVLASAGEARAVLPLARHGAALQSLANWYSFSARPIIAPGADGPVLLAAIARDLRRRAARITLAPLPDEDSSATLTEAAFAAAGWHVRREQSDINHVLVVGGRSFAEYFAARPGPLRTTLRRKAGKVEVALHHAFNPQAWAEYEAIYAASWKPQEGSPGFLRHFAQAEGAAGRLRLALAYVDKQPIAAQFWTVEHGTAYIHKLAHRSDARALSPGTTLSAALFERVIDRDRVEYVDFGTGDDAYKADWMEAVRPRYRLECLNPSAPRAWPRIARAALQQLARRGAAG